MHLVQWQGPYSIVEEFLFLVLQPVTCGADNIIIVSKFPSFHEFIQFSKQIKSLGAKSGEYDGWQSSSKPAFQMAVSAYDDEWAGALL